MMPDNMLSSSPVLSDLVYPDNLARTPLQDYEMGGIAISDPSEGLDYQAWTLTYDGAKVICTPADVGLPVTLFEVNNITELSLAFDQNMNVFVTYVVDDDRAWYFWYDPIAAEYLHQVMAVDVINPRCTIDDKRSAMVNTSDIILAYVRSGRLYFRMERERYETEHQLHPSPTGRFDKVAMGKNNRLHFEFLTSPSEVIIPPSLTKLEILDNGSSQGQVFIPGWVPVTFADYFTPHTMLGPNFTKQVDCSALEYISHPTGGTAYGVRIVSDGSFNEAMVLRINVSGYVSGSLLHRPEFGAFSPTLPLDDFSTILLIASDTGSVSIEKVTL